MIKRACHTDLVVVVVVVFPVFPFLAIKESELLLSEFSRFTLSLPHLLVLLLLLAIAGSSGLGLGVLSLVGLAIRSKSSPGVRITGKLNPQLAMIQSKYPSLNIDHETCNGRNNSQVRKRIVSGYK